MLFHDGRPSRPVIPARPYRFHGPGITFNSGAAEILYIEYQSSFQGLGQIYIVQKTGKLHEARKLMKKGFCSSAVCKSLQPGKL